MLAGKQATGVKIALTCEHGGFDLPLGFEKRLRIPKSVLRSHRGYDPGALDLFRYLIGISDFHNQNTASRLLIELNRSLHHPKLFSEFSKILEEEEKERLVSEIYLPYRNQTENWIRKQINEGHTVCHFSVHSFTPELNGRKRTLDLAWLYDPGRIIEKGICTELKKRAHDFMPDLRYQMNQPYKGVSDGFTKYLRSKFPVNYAGIEIEVNQRFVSGNVMDDSVKELLKVVLKEVVAS